MRHFLLLLPLLPATALAVPTEPAPQTGEAAQLVAQETTPVQPAEVDRNRYPYGSIQLGVGFPNDYHGTLQDTDPFRVKSTLNLNTGFNGEAAIGYRFNDIRTDLSVGYSNFGVDSQHFQVRGGDGASANGNGSVKLWTVMANLYYDMPIWKRDQVRSRWSPYVGAGIGYANISTPSCSVSNCFDGGSSGSFAWQAKLGVSYRATDSGSLFLEGGYLGTVGGSQVDSIRFDDFGAWRINIGWRQRFGGAPKAATSTQP